MDIERRFVFRGNAAAIGGRISRPKELVIEAGGASSLPVVGGRSVGKLPRTKFGDYVSLQSAATSAEGVFDDQKQTRELTFGRVREETLTSTTTVSVDVRGLAVANDPALRIGELRATMIGTSPRVSGEPSIKPGEISITGVEVGGHSLVVELDAELFARYDTRAKLLAASDDPKFSDQHGPHFLIPPASKGQPDGRRLLIANGTIYGTLVKRLRWQGRAFPSAKIDHHLVVAPGLGRLYFGEIFIGAFSRRLTLVRMALGSPVGGSVAAGEIETNGSWYP